MRYWIGVASREQMAHSIAGGFCQLCHGKAQALQRMSPGDGIIYYSPAEQRDGNTAPPCFTAIGQIDAGEVYAHAISHWFVSYRRKIRFHAMSEVCIWPLIAQLAFVRDKSRWSHIFRFGHIEIPRADFELIARHMQDAIPTDPGPIERPQGHNPGSGSGPRPAPDSATLRPGYETPYALAV